MSSCKKKKENLPYEFIPRRPRCILHDLPSLEGATVATNQSRHSSLPSNCQTWFILHDPHLMQLDLSDARVLVEAWWRREIVAGLPLRRSFGFWLMRSRLIFSNLLCLVRADAIFVLPRAIFFSTDEIPSNHWNFCKLVLDVNDSKYQFVSFVVWWFEFHLWMFFLVASYRLKNTDLALQLVNVIFHGKRTRLNFLPFHSIPFTLTVWYCYSTTFTFPLLLTN